MRIAITSDLYYPMSNGVATFAHNLAEGLANQGHDVLVLCPSFTGRQHKVTKGRLTTFYLRSIRFPFYPDQINAVPEGRKILKKTIPRVAYRHGIWITLEPYPAMKKALRKFRPDVIHNQTAEMIAIGAMRYAKKYDVPVVSTGHAYPDNVTGQVKLLKPIKKPVDAVLNMYFTSFLKNSQYATMPTKMAIDALVAGKQKHKEFTVEPLSNGVDLSKFKPDKPSKSIYWRYHLPKNDPLVLYVGRVDPEKSISNVVEAFAEVLNEVPKAKLVIVGDGTDREHLMDLAQALEISQSVIFPGRIMPPDLMEVYKTGRLFVTASETETQGIVLIEAAATGLPLVAVDAGAVKELCRDGQNGYLCQPGDIEQMAKAIVKVLQDKKKSAEFSQKSIEIARTHDLGHTIRRFIEIYTEAIRIKRSDD